MMLRLTLVLCVTLAVAGQGHADGWKQHVDPSHVRLRAIVQESSTEPDAMVLQRAISTADASFRMEELTAIVRIAAECCQDSALLSTALTGWLRESHPIYAGRLPTDASQFRGYLLASLSTFPANEELYSYVKTELLFAAHPFNIAAAAVAARGFPDRAEELLPLLERFLNDTFDDEPVDITTTELNYPLVHPTRARYEIIRTLTMFGHRAWRSLPALDAINACTNCGTWSGDVALHRQAAEAAATIRKVTPPCCRKPAAAAELARGLQLIEKRSRKAPATDALKLVDQDGRSLRFADLRGRPFALTFFYTQCTNAVKCVATVRRLRDLATACGKDDLGGRVGIYGMTYDPLFDTPAILKQYGKRYGLQFTRNVRLVKTEGTLGDAFREQLALRVSYGAGTVNQHGIQLYLFDKQGRLAATHDNELWSPVDVKNCLARLAAE